MKRLLTIFFLITAGWSFTAISADAQMTGNRGQDQIDDLRSEMERTNDILDKAAEIVRTANSQEGRLILEKALELNKSAWNDFGQKRYKMAAEKTKLVRELAQKAIAATRTAEENRDAVLRRLEHTKQLLERIRENSPQNVPPALRSLYESARDNLQRAWEFYNAGEYRPAVKLCNQVEAVIRKLMEAMQMQDRQGHFVQRRMEQVQNQIERLQAMIAECNSDMAGQLLDQARESLQRSKQFHLDGKEQAARAALQNAARLVNRAAEQCHGQDQFEKIYRRLVKQADRLAEQIDPDNEQARKLLDQTHEQLEIARDAAAKGNADAATAALRAAEMTLKQLQRQLGTQQGL